MTLDDLRGLVGRTLPPTAWTSVDQARIDAFAAVTGDRQWIHVDPERAANGPFGSTVAHGYLTLALLAPAHFELLSLPDSGVTVVNRGLDRVRFTAPVRSGARLRTHVEVADLADRRAGRWLLTTRARVEIEGEAKPALSATCRFLLLIAS